MATTASLPKCVQCGTALVSPEWSERADDGGTIHLWHCRSCGHEFQTTDDATIPELSDAELAEEFLPNLLVA